MKQISFNTGRSYTEHGQRIAARRLDSGAILMIDIDRHIDYLFPAEVELTQTSIMRAYDTENVIYPSNMNLSYEDYYSALRELREVALETMCI